MDSVREDYGGHSHQPKSVRGQYGSVREDYRGSMIGYMWKLF